jgi:homoserine O-acetyltransferase
MTGSRPPTTTFRAGPLLACCLFTAACAPDLQRAELGDLPTSGGGLVRGCSVAYRTFGALDASRSNAVLMPLWFFGQSAQAADQITRRRLVDPGRYFIVVVDPLGAGVSSSPSNSPLQPGRAFPRLSTQDLVESQHRLLTGVLGIRHLRGVVGSSMGGMQALAWATSHPDFMDVTVAIAATPRSLPAERDRWRGWAEEMLAGKVAEPLWVRLGFGTHRDPEDFALQAGLVAGQDVAAPFGGSLEEAARAVRSRLVAVVTPGDPLIDPAPLRAFARLAHGQVRELDPRCGHAAPSCDLETLRTYVAEALGGR